MRPPPAQLRSSHSAVHLDLRPHPPPRSFPSPRPLLSHLALSHPIPPLNIVPSHIQDHPPSLPRSLSNPRAPHLRSPATLAFDDY
ncbi:hypothetical protein BDN70DRAFT_879010 [Pholiota conissans]|uniref:Uncharacterized protein n=1 Tax=Pholiota conissans TaxID=109636 RepID=A0A9P6D0E2_9AGAR|nr:hypothetical protein BDN70DRAFT_879010 [Pholiota conissans]